MENEEVKAIEAKQDTLEVPNVMIKDSKISQSDVVKPESTNNETQTLSIDELVTEHVKSLKPL